MQTVILQKIFYMEEKKKKKKKKKNEASAQNYVRHSVQLKMATDENTARGQRWTIKIWQ